MRNRQNTHRTTASPMKWLAILGFCAVSVALWFFYFNQDIKNDNLLPTKAPAERNQTKTAASDRVGEPNFLPTSRGEIVRHQYFTLSYMEKYEQAEWVAYPLTRALLKRPNVPRSDWFNPDPLVSTGSARHGDYSGSGYTRGHLVPAGDMSFDKKAEEESFYMSNMSPQIRAFNNGVWKELEEQVRDWTWQNDEVIIVSGPIMDIQPRYIKNKVAIPKAFYKVILDVKEPVKKAIAFIIPHAVSEEHLKHYAVSIDSLEAITGIDFFSSFPSQELSKLEASYDLSLWPISDARYRLRVEKWNHQ